MDARAIQRGSRPPLRGTRSEQRLSRWSTLEVTLSGRVVPCRAGDRADASTCVLVRVVREEWHVGYRVIDESSVELDVKAFVPVPQFRAFDTF
jgi:hypothetical protein